MERLLEYFEPIHYTLNLSANRNKTRLIGETTIVGSAKSHVVKFHAVDLELKSVEVDGVKTSYLLENNTIVILGVDEGRREIKIKYSLNLTSSMQGAYLSTYKHEGEKQTIIATQFESHYARECFPCIDEPDAKAVFKLRISSDDDQDTIISNMPAELVVMQDGVKRVSFAETPRMSTYLVAFAIGKFVSYESVSSHGVKITTYAGLHQKVEDLKYAGDFAAEVLDFYDDRFGVAFPLPKLDLLALPDFEAGAMENWGLTTYREIALLANEDSSFEQKLYVCIVVAHELSHMWFGDLVTMKWWDDLWLNESFANLMESYSTAKLRPELGAWDDFYTSAVLSSLRRDCLPGVQPVKVDVENVEDIANLFDGAIVYGKGARLLLMLMRLIGEDKFFAGLKSYFDKHAYNNTTADDLWNAMSEFVDFDVREFMTPWLTQPGYPVITEGKQERFLETGDKDDTQYPIRRFADDLSGHYIYNLSDSELNDRISQVSMLGKEERLRLLIDRRLLARTDRVASASLLPLIATFEEETEPVVWDVISTIIGDLKVFFEPDSEEEKQFKDFVKRLVSKNYARLGIKNSKSDSSDDVKLRPIIMGLMLYSDYGNEFIDKIEELYGKVDINNIDTDYRWVVLHALIKSKDVRSNLFFKIYQDTPIPELKSDLSGALTATRNHDTAVSYLEALKDGRIRAQDRLGFFIRIARNHLSKKEAFDWMYENWAWLAEEEGDKTIAEYPRYSASLIRTEEEKTRFREFFEPKLEDRILTRDLKVAFAEIDARLKLIKSDRAAVIEALK